MSKIGLIIKREYLRRVSKKSFLLLTLFTPLLFTAMIFVPLWLSGIKTDEVKKVAIIDTTGKYASLFGNTEEYAFVSAGKSMDEYRNDPDKEIFAFLHIDGDLLQNPSAATIYSEKQIPTGLARQINNTLSDFLRNEKLASFNIPNLNQIIDESRIDFDIKTVKWSDDGSEENSSALAASIIGMILTLIIYMFILTYGSMVMQGVMEEKTNRIVEIIISSVKPVDLMFGKIIGIGFVGLTQIFLWGILTAAILSGSLLLFGGSTSPEDLMNAQMATQNLGNAATTIQAGGMETQVVEVLNSINFVQIGICFILYFIGGYLLYSALFAAIGSALEQQEDTQQFIMPIILILSFGLYAGMYSMDNPDGPLAFWGSIIPITSPIVMMVRLPFDVPFWQILLSIGLLYGTSGLIVWFSAKIYRVGILMYGKKPSIKEMIKWLRFK